jgi:hypothetical protein
MFCVIGFHMLVQLHKTCVSLDTQKMCFSDYTKHMLVPLHKTCVILITQNICYSRIIRYQNLERYDMTFLWTLGTVK